MSRNTPPGPSGLPFVGNSFDYLFDPLSFNEECVKEYGDVVNFSVGGEEMYLVAHPDEIEEVLIRRDDSFGKPDFFQDLLEGVFGEGLLTNEGDHWQAQRQLLQPMFYRENVSQYVDVITEYAEDLIDGWDDGEVYEVHEELGGLTLRIVTKIVLGVDLEDESLDLREDIENLYDRYLPKNQLIPEWVPTSDNREYKASLSRVNSFVREEIDDCRADDPDDDSMLATLLRARAESDRDISEKQIRDEVVTMILGGHETTTVLMTFALFVLAENPAIGDSLREEVAATFDGGGPTLADVNEFDLVDRFVRETMRLYPPSPVVLREAQTDVSLGEYVVPADSTVLLPQWVVHHDERFYDDPWEFDPERWTDARSEDRPRYAYFPFGGGSRQCIGRSFALVESQLLLALFADRCRFEQVTTDLDLRGAMTLQPDGDVHLRVHER